MRLSRTVLLCLAIAPIVAAQSLVSGPESPIVGGATTTPRAVSLVSNGNDFAAIWCTDTNEAVSAPFDARGDLRFSQVLARENSGVVIATDGVGYLAALVQGQQIRFGPMASTGFSNADAFKSIDAGQSIGSRVIEPFSLRAEGSDGGYLLTWKAREVGRTWLQAAIIGRDGKQREHSFILSNDDTAGVTSLARVGANFIAAYRTARGIEVAVIDPRRVSVIAQRLVAEVLADPMVVSADGGATLLYSLSLNGWNADAATYAISLNESGRTIGEAELVGNGRLLAATTGAIALYDQEVTLLRLCGIGCVAEEIGRLEPRFRAVQAIASNSSGIFVAAVAATTEFVFTGNDGAPPRIELVDFVSDDFYPRALAVAGDVALVLWSKYIAGTYEATYGARFRNGMQLDSTPIIRAYSFGSVIASDGTSSFLEAATLGVVDERHHSVTMARILPLEGSPGDWVTLGQGDPSAVIWDGEDYLVFFIGFDDNLVDRVLRVARVRRDGQRLSPAGGTRLVAGIQQYRVFAAPTKSGFVVAYTLHEKLKTGISAFSLSFAPLGTLSPQPDENLAPTSIAGDGNDRIAVGLGASQSEAKTIVVNDRAEKIALKSDATWSMIWSGGGFFSFFPSRYAPTYATLWHATDSRTAISDLPRIDVERTDYYPFMADAGGHIVALYARHFFSPKYFPAHSRMFLRTFTVLPKGEPAP